MKKSIKNILLFFWKLVFPIQKQNYLFLMGHPRSGSSLLMHILTSNKDIIGFGEYLIKYTSDKSFIKAEFDIRRKAGGLFKRYYYVANQVNHHSITPKIELLKANNIKVIILIRKPEETLSSMFLLSKLVNKSMTQKSLTSVYIERLKYLSKVITQLDPLLWTFTTYEDLITNTDIELKKLSHFLNLHDSLKSNYTLKKYTQIWGDPSENIKKGGVFKIKSKQIQFEEELLMEANNSYQETLTILQQLCINN